MVYLHRPYPELTSMVNAASYVGAILMAFWLKTNPHRVQAARPYPEKAATLGNA
jgi:hypothetical protein